MSGQHTNLAFVSDEQYTKAPSGNKDDVKTPKDAFTVELSNITKEREAYESYDPYMHRQVKRPTTNSETLLHLLKGSLGTGILAMPNAFYHSGYLVGIVGTLVIGIICTYCVHMLVKAQYELSKRRKVPSLSYTGTAEAAMSEGPLMLRKFAPYSVHVVNVFLIVYQLGACCVYTVFISTNIKSVVDAYADEISLEIYILMLLIPLIILNWVRKLKHLAPFSTIANAITMVSFGIILYYLIKEKPSFENVEPIGKVEHLPLFFGTVLFALEAIGVILPLENEMKTPRAFGGSFGILNVAMSAIIILYVGMGLLGYLTYGDAALGSITLNLPMNEPLAQAIKGTLALAIFITHGLQFYVAIDILWTCYLGPKLEKNSKKLVWEYSTRTILVIITVLIAIAVPELDLFISLNGAFCLSAVGIAFPALIDMFTYWYTYTGSKFYLMAVKDIAIIIFAISGLTVGTYVSVSNIIQKFTGDE